MTASAVQHDLGPALPARGDVYAKARELRELAQLAAELSSTGPQCDVPRAAAYLDRARAILGPSAGVQA